MKKTITLDIAGATSFSGGGRVAMPGALVTAIGAGNTLDNIDNTIVGFGTLDPGTMGLTNEAAGTLVASAGTLNVSVSGATITNHGIMRAVAGIWQGRGDNYSERRAAGVSPAPSEHKVEMSYIGG